MNLSRGGALTALTLIVAVGCGTSDASPPADDGGVVAVSPDGGEPLPPAPQEPVDGAPPPDGVFVSASKGLGGADGTMGRPVPTIAEAIAIAIQKRMPINVCAETYKEVVHLADGITMFGYYDCSDLANWRRVDKRAQLLAPGPVVRGDNLVVPAKLAGFDIEALDAAPAPDGSPAASSIAMLIRSSRNLALSNVSIRSAKGQDGANGVEPAPNEQLGTPNGYNGKKQQFIDPCLVGNVFRCNQTYASGSVGGTSKCKVGAIGGPGGEGGDGRSFDPNPRGAGASYLGQGGDVSTAAGGNQINGLGSQADGRDGNKGPNGNAGSNGTWKFHTSGDFVPGDGSPGLIGGPGQGGGGGGGSLWYYCNA
ncbi:MAG: hypothetical protein K0S65_1927, partial [Labilithrix sp.]|nr:hypothetical protein [Labilithrix sp.]